VGRIKVM